ncbi:LamG-like jellyroll fold domain-containing protein [Nocardioides deserti]|uniref:Ig-like domain repeat protein n=1 Tax=Nocardioides deserti TaxID=1588644 RepID=A0ABR6U513_9ACTN|nr:LamG-like jellyroll fold domain-containing protein [Nocardioides deserti]MBC2959480.1 Ig-like domain repeat protein [Nocardioides deserti]GGO73647.1 hypothetical protein GCM10012276_19780 [Nocardioides deserti]
MSPTQAAPAEVVDVAAASPTAAATEVPEPDVFDVDFGRGTPDDRAQGFAATPVDRVTLVDDADLGQTVASFDGTDDAYHYDDFATSWTDTSYVRPTTQVTVQCTFKYTGPVPPTGNVAVVCGNNVGSYMLYIQGSALVSNVKTSASNWMSAPLAANRWMDVVITYDGSSMATYVDGEVVHQFPRTGPIPVPAAGAARAITIGDSLAPGGAGHDFTGRIAASRVWSTALTADQVRALHGVEEPEEQAVPAADVFDVDFARGTADDRAQGFAATAMDGATLVEDPELGRKVATFDGVDDAFRYPDFATSWTDPAYVRPTTQMTMQCRFKYTGPVPPRGNVAMICGNNGGSYMAYLQGSNLVTNIRQGASNWMNTPFAARQNQWVDVVITYDGSRMATYVDGEVVNVLPRTGAIAVPAAGPARGMTIGDSLVTGNENHDFTGQVASSRIWSTALAPAQVRALHAEQSEQPEQPEEPELPGVPAADVFDVDFARGTADDRAQGFAATAMDGATLVEDPELGRRVATFDGVDDAFRYPDFATSWTDPAYVRPTTQMTMQCRFKYTGPVPPKGNVAMICGNNGGSYMAYLQGSNLVTNIRQGASNWMNTPFAAGSWVDAVITYDGTTMTTYVDGRVTSQLARTGPIAVPAAGPARGMTIGDSLAPGSEAFDFTGQIASVRVWSRALTPEQVKAISGTEEEPDEPQQPEEPDEPGVAPRPNVLDVDFGRGTPDDRAQGFAATAVDGVSLLRDDELGQTVASFDGDKDAYHYDDFAEIWTNSDYVRPTGSFTQQCKFRYTGATLPTQPQLVCRVHGTGGFGMWVNGSTMTSALRTTTTNDWLASRYQKDEWVDAVQTYDGTTWKVYLDGELTVSKERTGQILVPATVDRPYTLADWPGGTGIQSFEGDIAASRVWTRALTAEQVMDLHEGNVKELEPTQPRLVPDPAVLDIDFSRGTADDAAQGFKATAVGGASLVRDAELGQTVARLDGDQGAYRYSGFSQVWTNGQYVRPTTAFTQQCKFRYTGASAPSGVQYTCQNNSGGGFGMWIEASGMTANLQTTRNNAWIAAPFKRGEWVDAVQTYDGSTWKLYVNGELASSAARQGDVRGGSPHEVGGSPANAAWNFEGDVAASRVWDTALTPYQVKALHAGSADIPEVDVVETVPATGSDLREAVPFEVRRKNADAATGWTYLLDGEPIEPGDMVGPGLAAGAHEIVISAVGPLGENRKWRVSFTSEVMPAGGGTETGQGAGKVTLSAIASNPAGGRVTTTFTEALVTSASEGFQGVVDTMPTTLEFDYREGSELVGLQEPDGQLADSPSSRDTVFQRFDVDVPASDARREVVWSGVVDAARSVTLLAWHVTRQEWVELASARGEAGGDTMLKGRVRPGFVDEGTVHLMVVGQDPFADDLAPRDASANLPENRDHFEDPEDYDFAIAHFSDTQNMTQIAGNVCPQYNPGAEHVARQAYSDLTSWISGNSEARKIAYTAHTGDLIESNMTTYPALCAKNAEQVAAEFAFTDEMQAILDDSGVVNSVLAGNHDNAGGTDTGAGNLFNQTFGPDRYYAASQAWPAGASYHPWDEVLDEDGDVVTPGVDNDNNYILFSAGGLDFVAVSLSYGVTEAEADWASSVFERHSDRSGVLLTHAYLSASTMSDGRSAGRTGDGGALYERVVVKNPNVFLVLAGHIHGVATNVVPDSGVTVDRKHGVVELLADYQEYRVPAREVWPDQVQPGGGVDLDDDGVVDYGGGDGIILGASFLRLLQIDIEKSTMSVDTYSPYLDNFGTTEYDTSGRYNGAEDNFTVPIDLPTRTTGFATDGLSVLTATDTVIGERTVASGWPATVEWTGLTEGELYGWLATSRDASGTNLGRVQQFGGVVVANAAGADVTAPVLTVPAAAQVRVGGAFDPMQGVTALDATDGDLTSQVQVVGVVDPLTPGVYPLVYSVADANGNTAQAVQVVTVVAASSPQQPQQPQLTATTVQASNLTTPVGGTATLRATITPSTATGTVRFLMGEALVCEAAVVDGAALCATSALQAAGSYSVDAVYSGDAGHEPSRRSFVLTVTDPPVASAVPTISGTPEVGQVLTAQPGAWTEGATLSYQWLRDGEAVTGATGRTYTAVAADAGTRVSVQVTGAKEGHVSTSETSTGVTVAPGTLAASKPRVTGKARVGKKLTAKTGTWTDGARLSFRWYANGQRIKVAKGKTLKLTRNLQGKRIVVEVVGTKAGYTTVVKSSTARKVKRRR